MLQCVFSIDEKRGEGRNRYDSWRYRRAAGGDVGASNCSIFIFFTGPHKK